MAEAISLCWIIIELACLCFFCECFMERRKWGVVTAVSSVISLCWIFWYANYYVGMIPSTLFTPVTYYIISLVCYKGNWQHRIISVFMCALFLAIIDAVMMYLFCALLKINIVEFTSRKYTFFTVGTVSKFSSLLLSWQCFRIFTKTTDKRLQTRWIVLTLLFPGISYIVLIIIVLNYRLENDISIKALGITSAIALANIGTMYMINHIEKSEKDSQRAALLDQQMNIQTQSIMGLEKSYRSQRAISHEFTHHLNAISALLESQQYKSAEQYIQTLQEQQTTRVFVVNSHHAIVDAILNQRYQSAKERGIDMHIKVSDLSELGIPTEMIVVILSNLLDNAIEACERYSGEKVIQLSMILADKLTLSIRNTTEPVQFIVNGFPITTKSDKQNHGYGLQNVERLLDDLNAEHAWSYQDNWFSFVAEIPTT